MNARNLLYVRPSNPKRAVRLANNKLATKKKLMKAGLPTAKLFGVIYTKKGLRDFDFAKVPDSFALKPCEGYGGEGIIVTYAKSKKGFWRTIEGGKVTVDDLKAHITNILDGNFSMSNTPDTAFFEKRLAISKRLKRYSPMGTPDIRVIVFNNVPVMAQLRLPTRKSKGKANITSGAICVGIDIASGVTTYAVKRTFYASEVQIETHPDNGRNLSGIKIPFWDDILNLAIDAQRVSGLGYLGTDIVIDRNDGLMILENNAHPGFAIQNANLAGLKERLERVSGLKISSNKKGIRVAKELFGGEITETIEDISGKKVLGTIEPVTIIGPNGKKIQIDAKVDTGADLSSLDEKTASSLGYKKAFDYFQALKIPQNLSVHEARIKVKEINERLSSRENIPIKKVKLMEQANAYNFRPFVDIELIIKEKKYLSQVTLQDRSTMKYDMILGRNILKNFLVEV